MAVLDSVLELSDYQDVNSVTSASTEISANVIDLTGGNVGRDGFYKLTRSTNQNIADMFRGGTVYMNVKLDNAGTVTSGVTLQARLYVHSASSAIHNGNELVRVSFPNAAAAGTIRSVSIPNTEFAYTERYMGISYFASGSKVTTIRVSAWLSNYPAETQITGTSLT